MVKHDRLGDEETVIMLANDPFHKGLEKHGEFKTFSIEPLTDDDIKASQLILDRFTPKVCKESTEG